MQRTLCANVQPLTNLRQWLYSHGGGIHPAVGAGLSPHFGCRGLLSLEDIPYADNGQQTIILLPKALQITDAVAKAVLADKLSAGSIQDLEAESALKGVLLAYERNQRASFWGPYLASLPAQPSAGWFLKSGEVATALQKLGMNMQAVTSKEYMQGHYPTVHMSVDVPGCKAAVKAKRKQQFDIAKTLTNRFGRALGVSASDMLWGLATACCRGYRGPDEYYLFPVIDLCNHSTDGALVQGVRVADEEFVRGIIQQQHGERALQAGQEVLQNYGIAGQISACEAFVDYGFVPG